MPKYIAKAEMTTYLFIEFEADNQEDADKKAEKLDGASFQEIPNTGGWEIYNTEPAENDLMKDKGE